MMIVRVILVDTTRPVRIRPRIETSPVNGHFLSAFIVRFRLGGWDDRRTDVMSIDGLCRRLKS